jgi:hypothetical protein
MLDGGHAFRLRSLSYGGQAALPTLRDAMNTEGFLAAALRI